LTVLREMFIDFLYVLKIVVNRNEKGHSNGNRFLHMCIIKPSKVRHTCGGFFYNSSVFAPTQLNYLEANDRASKSNS
jgi:hypothetical protein